jgi:hypothetical protein
MYNMMILYGMHSMEVCTYCMVYGIQSIHKRYVYTFIWLLSVPLLVDLICDSIEVLLKECFEWWTQVKVLNCSSSNSSSSNTIQYNAVYMQHNLLVVSSIEQFLLQAAACGLYYGHTTSVSHKGALLQQQQQ